MDAVSHAFTSGSSLCQFDRAQVIVKAEELGFRKRLRHENCRGAEAAANIADLRSCAEFLFHAIEGRNPERRQVRYVVRAEESLGAVKEVVMVLVPANALACLERLFYFSGVIETRGNNLKSAGEEG